MITVLPDAWSGLRAEARLTLGWARRELHSTYRQSSLRLLWSILQPLSVVAVYVVVFHWILAVPSDGVPYLSFMVVGLAVWRYFAIGLSRATSLVDQAHVLNRVYFRREIVPLSGCLSGLIDLGIGTVAAVVVATAQGMPPGPSLVALPLVYLPLLLYTGAAAVLLSTVTVFVRDVGMVMPTLAQLMFLATPIMYPPSQLPAGLGFLQVLNPIAVLVEQARRVVLQGQWPSPAVIGLNVGLGSLLFVGSVAYLRSIEHRIVDVA